jgi:hypothetical protein
MIDNRVARYAVLVPALVEHGCAGAFLGYTVEANRDDIVESGSW